MSNVVQFSQNKKQDIVSAKQTAIDEAVTCALQHLTEIGYPICSEKDIGFICEAITSGVERSEGIKHPLQELADRTIILK